MKQKNCSIIAASVTLCVSPETIQSWLDGKNRIDELENIISSKDREIHILNEKIDKLKQNILKQLQ